jgi:predicted Zn-dependent protease
MFTKRDALHLLDAAVDFAGTFAAVEVTIMHTDSSTFRFANNEATTHLRNSVGTIGVQVRTRTQCGSATGNDFSPAGMRRLVAQAADQAQSLRGRISQMSVLKPNTRLTHPNKLTIDQFDGRIATMDARQRRQAAQKMINVGLLNGLRAAGIVTPSIQTFAYGNSKGMRKYCQESHLEASVTMVGKTSSGWAKAVSAFRDGIEFVQLAELAAQRALRSRNPISLRPAAGEENIPAVVPWIKAPMRFTSCSRAVITTTSAGPPETRL